MDEIVIEDKKYVSSKRAAKVTGYAKDYIGQLCREGRVPARFVGRNWYVLESAIQDHRFGSGTVDKKEIVEEVIKPEAEEPMQKPVLPPTWESPRYEASTGSDMPSVNRLRAIERVAEPAVEPEETTEAPRNLEESWQAWFSNFNKAPETESTTTESVGEEEPEPEIVPEEIPEIEVGEVSVPIHTVYQLPPEALLPHKDSDEEIYEDLFDAPVREVSRLKRVAMRAIQTTGILLATVMVVLAIVGTGYLDNYIISDSPVSLIAGAMLYNK